MFPPSVVPDILSDNKTGTKEVDVISAILKKKYGASLPLVSMWTKFQSQATIQ